MANADPIGFYPLVLGLATKKIDLSTDTLKWLLTNTQPSRSWANKSEVTGELATGGGYTAGGNTSAIISCTQTSGVLTLVLADPPTWTGTGAGFGPFRYAVCYDFTATQQNLICYYDHGSSISVASGQTYNTDLNQTTGLLKLSLVA